LSFEGLGAGAAAEGVDYKSRLNSAAAKRAKRSLVKGELTYTVLPGPTGWGYIASVSSATMLTQEYWGNEPAANKKQAEHMAARVAMEAEYPEELVGIDMAQWADPSWLDPMAGRGKKRKLEAGLPGMDVAPGEDSKSQLIHAAQLLLGRSISKEDVAYDVQEAPEEPGKFVATVRIPEYDAGALWAGVPAPNQKEAQMRAAEAAMEVLQHLVGPLEEERRLKKLSKRRETNDKSRQMRDARRHGMSFP